MRRTIKKSMIVNLDAVYSSLGVTHQHISYWRNNPASTLTKGSLKFNVILKTGDLFGLNATQMEDLANKAGLSLKRNTDDFAQCFGMLLAKYPGKMTDLCSSAIVSERMLRYIRAGKHLKKESILALLIAMEQDLDVIQAVLMRAGFILSKSLPHDTVIAWTMEKELSHLEGARRIQWLNEVLHSLDLPLLMSRSAAEL